MSLSDLAKQSNKETKPDFSKDFGKLDKEMHFNPAEQKLPDFKKIGSNYKNIIRQERISE